MTLKGGTAQACAACKYQRRKCTSECLLAPYFPADQPKMFQNVHKLFGVSNIKKMLKMLDPSQKKIAMDSMIFQANTRDKYPVHGCWEEICRLRYAILGMEEELNAVHQQLQICRQQYQHHNLPEQDHQLKLGMSMTPYSNNGHQLIDQMPLLPQDYTNIVTVPSLPPMSQQQQHYFSNSNNEAYNTNDGDHNSLYIDIKDSTVPNSLWAENPNGDNNGSSMAIQSQLDQPLVIQQGEVVAKDYNEMHPFLGPIDDRQSYDYSKEAYESSSEESLKDTPKCAEHVAENELKNAAACFSLTSVN